MAIEPFETAEKSEFPFCRQLSVFLENRLGQLLRLTRLFDNGEIHIRALSVEGSIDCAIVRLLVDDPDTGREMISNAGFAVTESDVLVVQLPPGKRGLMSVCAALIAGEVNINYVYALLAVEDKPAQIAISVDNLVQAARTLAAKKFRVLDQSEL